MAEDMTTTRTCVDGARLVSHWRATDPAARRDGLANGAAEDRGNDTSRGDGADRGGRMNRGGIHPGAGIADTVSSAIPDGIPGIPTSGITVPGIAVPGVDVPGIASPDIESAMVDLTSVDLETVAMLEDSVLSRSLRAVLRDVDRPGVAIAKHMVKL
ncbi:MULTISPECIES: hypothetical protein [unclassified Frankia]|uniref:hypothetical protein n=1 Tax=unclassified Frankia TaxID=2632575 RepID=UPI002025A2CC